jgi:biopolymer transport protein ExbB/TolQ
MLLSDELYVTVALLLLLLLSVLLWLLLHIAACSILQCARMTRTTR